MFSVLKFSFRILTEQYDGIRALWTGEQIILKGKHQRPQPKPLVPPLWFQEQLPSNLYVDGELWYGYGNVQKLNQLLANPVLNDSDWNDIQFIAFDSPDHTIRDKSYMQRLQLITQALPQYSHNNASVKNVSVVQPRQCHGIDDMDEFLIEIVERGGEGVVLRDRSAPYLPGFPIMWKKDSKV